MDSNCLDCAQKIDNSCKPIDASCVKVDSADLNCIAEFQEGVDLKTVLETWDDYFCEFNNIALVPCIREKLGLPASTETISQTNLLLALQNYLCTMQDIKVKAGQGDASSGYLIDKLQQGDCIILSLVEDDFGNQKVKVSVDIPCISTKIEQCFTINTDSCIEVKPVVGDCLPKPLTPVISKNGTTLTGVNCNGVLQWFNSNNQLIGTGLTVSVSTGDKYFARCANTCGESINSNIVDVPVSTIYTKTRTAIFTRNNCGTNECSVPCIGTSVTYTKTYTSTISQEHANSLAENDVTFALDGQAQANATGTCTCSDCNCVFPIYNSNVIVTNATCNGSVIAATGQIFISGIGNANKFGYSIGSGNYAGPSYAAAFNLTNLNQGNLEITPTTIRLKSLSIESAIKFRLFNGAENCFTDITVALTPPDCTQEQVSIEDITVSCELEETPCKNYTISAGGATANFWFQECNATAYSFRELGANLTTTVCSKALPLASGATVTENGNC